MSRQKKKKRIRASEGGTVYSTAADWMPLPDKQELVPRVEREATTLYVSLSRKHRAGKPVTVVEGLDHDGMVLMTMGKELKTLCGAGGSVKDGAILVQGDHYIKIVEFLIAKGFRTKRKGG